MTDQAQSDRPQIHLFDAPAALDDPFAIYVHIPFCTHICPYCDFNTYSGQETLIPAYVEALKQENHLWQSNFIGRMAQSIFIGGGTPSLLTADQISVLLEVIRHSFDVAADAELTIETNPNDLTERYCSELLRAGINRLSIGGQTFDRRGLRVLGRLHDARQISDAVAAARAVGFANLSLDLIYGWPGQTIDCWRDDLDRVLNGDVGGTIPDHLSVYGLIIEPGTPIADAVHRGILTPVGDDAAADFSELAAAALARAGWTHYEIANWCATPAKASQHNAIYWRNGDYIGLGAGAHGHVGNNRTMNQPSPRRYIDVLGAGKSPRTNTESIDEETAMAETMMLGLRLLLDGVSRQAFAMRHGIGLAERFGSQIDQLHARGLLLTDERSVRLTERGAMLANVVSAEFL